MANSPASIFRHVRWNLKAPFGLMAFFSLVLASLLSHIASMTCLGKTCVLVVEDEEPIRFLAAEVLRDAGFEVIEAEDGDQAFSLMKSLDHVDVVFTDVRMPGSLDGFDMIQEIRRDYPAIPALIASGYARYESSRLAALSPPTRFISKPYSLAKMVQLLEELAAGN